MKSFDEIAIWDSHWNQISEIENLDDLKSSIHPWTIIHFPIIDKILSEMASNSLFLEAGCGLGQWCFYARKKYCIKTIGVDIAKDTIGRLNK